MGVPRPSPPEIMFLMFKCRVPMHCLHLSIALLAIGLCCGAAFADQPLSVVVAIDDDCAAPAAMLVVPAGMKAVRLSAAVDSSWLPCGGAGRADRVGFSIAAPSGTVLVHHVQREGGVEVPAQGDLSSLELPPGAYVLAIVEKARHTRIALRYQLIAAGQPTEGILPPEGRAPPPPAVPAIVSGQWKDPETGMQVAIAQKEAAVSAVATLRDKERTFEFRGEGSVEGNIVRIDFAFTGDPLPGWEDGALELRLVEPRTLSGMRRTRGGEYSRNITLRLMDAGRKARH